MGEKDALPGERGGTVKMRTESEMWGRKYRATAFMSGWRHKERRHTIDHMIHRRKARVLKGEREKRARKEDHYTLVELRVFYRFRHVPSRVGSFCFIGGRGKEQQQN